MPLNLVLELEINGRQYWCAGGVGGAPHALPRDGATAGALTRYINDSGGVGNAVELYQVHFFISVTVVTILVTFKPDRLPNM